MIVLLIVLASVSLFTFGALVGSSLETQGAAYRSRHLAVIQREINDQARALEAVGVLEARQVVRYVNYEIGSR